MKIRNHGIAAWTLSFLLLAAAFGQSELSTLTGIVTDQTGAVLVKVTVAATNVATNLSASTVTNESGRYVLQSMKPGTYVISMTFPGFKKLLSSSISLQVNQTARLDAQLEIGPATEQVTVSDDAPLFEPETSNRGALIDGRKIVELPLNGRDYNQLALLSPGVLAPTPRLQSIGFKGAFNANGNRAFRNAFLLDGVDNTSYSNSYRGNNIQVVQPSVEALQEFKIQTNAYAAEFGRSSGALINAVVKSGGNSVHGSAYEFHRNDNLDAANFFANKNGLAKPFPPAQSIRRHSGRADSQKQDVLLRGLRGPPGPSRPGADFFCAAADLGAGPVHNPDFQSVQSRRHWPGVPTSGHT